MMRGIGWLLAVLLLAVGCWWMYSHVTRGNVSGSGDVFSRNESPDSKDIAANPTKDESAPTPAPVGIPAAVASSAPVAAPPQQAAAQSLAVPQAATAPVSDSVTPNPANGMAFGGGGKYQWYRQGNLTWRIDTASGISCIDFATMEEWQKPIVYSHGCGTSHRS